MYTHTHNAKYIAVSKREKEGLVENKKQIWQSAEQIKWK